MNEGIRENRSGRNNRAVAARIALAAFFALFLACASCGGDRYGSRAIDEEGLAGAPSEAVVEGITRISDSRAYCMPTCLRMIADSAGIHESIEYVNWVTGFTYGGFRKDSFAAFMPISDVMLGLRFGAPYLGLEQELYGSADRDIAVRAIKRELANGTPVMLMYDYNAIAGGDFFFPHAAVLVGYVGDDFLYFEPGFSDAYEPRSFARSRAPIDAFMTGARTLQRKFTGTEGYSYMVYRSRPRETDYAAVWERDGKELRGISVPFIGIATGARACRALADEVAGGTVPAWGWERLLPVWFAFGRYSRDDNARFLIDLLGEEEGREIARLCSVSSGAYGEIEGLLATGGDYAVVVPPLLRRVADAEDALGTRFLSIAKRVSSPVVNRE